MIAVAYIRVSTTEQDFGPEAQRNDIQAWCAKNGYTLDAANIFEDRLSGATLPEDSPALMAAFEAQGFREHWRKDKQATPKQIERGEAPAEPDDTGLGPLTKCVCVTYVR